MADDTQKIDFTQSIAKLDQINTWFQSEEIDLDEGLNKLREGNDLIKKCRARLQEVENEFVKIKQEFVQEETPVAQATALIEDTDHITKDEKPVSPDDIPF